MREINLDGSGWRSDLDFIRDLLAALGAPDWHGKSINALLDSMVVGDINEVEPPYVVRVRHFPDDPEILAFIVDLRDAIVEHRLDHARRYGRDVEVSVEIVGGD